MYEYILLCIYIHIHISKYLKKILITERLREMKKLRLEKINISRHLKNAEEDHQIALNTVDNKDDEATTEDRYVYIYTYFRFFITVLRILR
jgi:hypothetical protein